jgi:hypothetical protein
MRNASSTGLPTRFGTATVVLVVTSRSYPEWTGSRHETGASIGPREADLMARDDGPVVELVQWDGQWPADDPDANFKADIALYGKVDPLATIERLAANLDVPVGAICRYVLARWASEGSGGLLELGPRMVERLWAVCAEAEARGDDAARLAAYAQLRQMLSWLRLPLEDDAGYAGGAT